MKWFLVREVHIKRNATLAESDETRKHGGVLYKRQYFGHFEQEQILLGVENRLVKVFNETKTYW